MQVVILAAGKSSRFYPFTNIPHKSSLKVLGKSLIEHTMLSIKKAGLTEVVIVISADTFIKELLGDGERFGLHITYVTQPEALGMGDALLRVKEVIQGDFYLLNATHIDFHEFSQALADKKSQEDEIVLLTRRVENPERFGILEYDHEGVIGIVEKPSRENAPSDLKVIGIYLLPKKFLETLESVNLEHYNLEAAITAYAKSNPVSFTETSTIDVSLKYPWDLLQASAYLMKDMKTSISDAATISEHAVITGEVIMEDGVQIMEGACIKGPVYLGKNVYVGNNAIVRHGAVIEADCVIGANTEVKNSILFTGTKTHTGVIEDSVIGEDCRLGAFFCTANRRMDRKPVRVTTDKDIDSGLTFLGAILGNNVVVGAGVITMPGVVIGRDSMVGPGTTVMKSIKERSKYYSKFEIVHEEIDE